MPQISVVMAAKDYARFLPTAVGSVLRQTLTDWELVIVDDGSADGTPAAVAPYLADRRIRYVRSDKLGQPRAKNLGARLTTGDWIAYLDADDAWLPNKLEAQLAELARHPAAGVAFCLRTLIGEDGEPLPDQPAAPPPPRGEVLSALFARNFVCFSSVLIRREVFEAVGGFDPDLDLAIDYDFWLRAARHTEFACVDDKLVLYRTGHGNLSKKLADRVLTADSIMTRAVERRGLADILRAGQIGEGYASTYRALAYTLRPSEPWAAAKWYWRAAMCRGNRPAAVKGLATAMARWAGGRREVAGGENATANR